MSKPLPFQIPKDDPWSFRFQEDNQPVLYSHLHMHPEIQIMWMVSGQGTWFIADAFGSYTAGDVFVIGSNVPHVFKSEQLPTNAHALSIFFKQDAFGAHFFELPELSPLNHIWEHARSGLRLPCTPSISDAFKLLLTAEGPARMSGLMHLFEALVATPHEVLSPGSSTAIVGTIEGERLDRVITYLMDHYNEDISLDKVADLAHMTPTSFCRFFKRRTRRTLIQFLNDLRLNAVKKLLVRTELPVAEIALQCGFQNLSHFNKLFRKHTSLTPSGYRQRYREAL